MGYLLFWGGFVGGLFLVSFFWFCCGMCWVWWVGFVCLVVWLLLVLRCVGGSFVLGCFVDRCVVGDCLFSYFYLLLLVGRVCLLLFFGLDGCMLVVLGGV